MRIKDLATRATKLLTGSAYMVFDNGTKVEKVDYAELAKQIITEYNTQTLAGSAQSVKSALDALNSNTNVSRNSLVATSSNGSFNTLCNSDGTYAVYVSDSSGNYCYGQFTIKLNAFNKWTTIGNNGITYDVANAIGTIVFKGGTGTYTAKVTRLAYTPSNNTIEELNSKTQSTITAASGWTVGDVNKCTKVNQMVSLDYWCSASTVTVRQWITIGTVPSDYRPAYMFDFVAVDNSGVTSGVQTKIEPAGAIKVYLTDNRSLGLRLHAVYMT